MLIWNWVFHFHLYSEVLRLFIAYIVTNNMDLICLTAARLYLLEKMDAEDVAWGQDRCNGYVTIRVYLKFLGAPVSLPPHLNNLK